MDLCAYFSVSHYPSGAEKWCLSEMRIEMSAAAPPTLLHFALHPPNDLL